MAPTMIEGIQSAHSRPTLRVYALSAGPGSAGVCTPSHERQTKGESLRGCPDIAFGYIGHRHGVDVKKKKKKKNLEERKTRKAICLKPELWPQPDDDNRTQWTIFAAERVKDRPKSNGSPPAYQKDIVVMNPALKLEQKRASKVSFLHRASVELISRRS
jgi:hypothetical protein